MSGTELSQGPRNRMELAGAVVVAILLALVGRMLLGLVVSDSVQKITYVGVTAGALGALAMTAVMWNLADQELPTSGVWAQYVAPGTDADPGDYRLQGLFAHVTYGAILGAFYPRFAWGVFGPDQVNRLLTGGGESELFTFLVLTTYSNDWMGTLPWSVVPGLLFGLLVFLPAVAMVAGGLIDMEMSPENLGRFLGLHLLYGLVVGVVAGLYNPIIVPAWGAIF